MTWHPAYSTLNLDAELTTTCLALSPNFATMPDVFAGVTGFIMRSNDAGKNWLAIPLPNASPHSPILPSAIAISPNYSQDGVLLVGTNEDGVLRSVDRGNSWAAWNFGLVDCNTLCLAVSPSFAKDMIVYAGTSSGLFYSQNGGKSWKERRLPCGLAPVLSLAISPDFESDGILLVGAEDRGLYVSKDRGQKWERLGADVIIGSVNQIALAPGFPAHGDLLVAHENTVLQSGDGGQTWSVLLEGEVAAMMARWNAVGQRSLLIGLIDGSVHRH
jgi:hypothetical protein